MKLGQSSKKQIALKRIRFLIHEVVWVFIIIFICLLIPIFVVPLFVEEGSPLYGILFYSLRAIFVFAGIPLILILFNLIFETQKKDLIIEEDISPAKGHLMLYKISRKNYKYQMLYGLLIFFLVFLPIDFFGYLLVPQMLDYQAIALGSKTTDSYLLSENYLIFLISVIIIQFSVSITEETISRGLLTKRGSEHFFKISAVFISALYFGLGHFAYFLDPISRLYPFWFPIVWFTQAFIIGIILSLLVIRRKWIFPAIIAHALNNIISAHAVWSYWQGNDFMFIGLYLYYPLLIIGCMLFTWNFSLIKESLSIGFNMLKTYFKRDKDIEITKGDSYFRVFFDILMGIMIFIMGFMIMI
ncbi:MAG: CPBP family intramembrane glutamic endopeptidase [Candidatus Thorarchaeota archaeon]